MLTLTSPGSGSSTTLGENITVSGTAAECRSSTSCNVAVVVVHGIGVAKVGFVGSGFSATVQTVSNVSTQCAPNLICIRQTGPYRVSVWIANDTIANGTENSIGNSGHPTIPADATATFFVAPPVTLSANLSANSVVVGDTVTLTGTVAKATPRMAAWAFDAAGATSNGRCYYREITPADGSFTWTLDRSITGRPGTWSVFLLSPGPDLVFRTTGGWAPPFANVDPLSADNTCTNGSLVNKDGPQIRETLKAATDSQRYDDEYRVFTLAVNDIFLRLDPLSTAYLNDTLTVSGRSSGNGSILVSIAGSLFEKQQVANASGGVFTASFDTTVSSNVTWPWTPGKYSVRAVGPEGKSDTLVVELVPKRPSEFKVDNLVVLFSDGTAMDGRAPAVGQTMTASAVLINKGEEAGNATLYFQLSGRTLCSPTTALKGGQYAVATCNFTVNHTGTYTLQVDGKSVTLNVRGPKLPEVTGEVKSIPSLAGGAQARLLFSGAVDQVVLQARSPVSAAEVISQPLDDRPESAAAPPGTPFRYFRLSSVNLPDAAVGSMNVVFRVDGAWLAEKKLGPGTVRLYRLATPSAGGAPVWRVESDLSQLGTDKRADGSSDVLYQAKVTAFGDFAVVGGSTEGAISAPGEAGPLAIFTNIPVMAAIAAGAGFFVFAWRKGWLPFLRRKKVPEGGAAPGVLTAGEAAALPRTYEDEVLSLFQSGQMVQAFRRLFDEVAGPLKAALGAEGTLSSGELMREAESKGLDPTLLTTLGQLFATCDAARFSGIPPTEEHLKWALRAARSVFARLSGGGALPASTGGGAVPEATGPVPGADYAEGAPDTLQPGAEPGTPPEGPGGGGYEAAGLPPEGEAPPGPEAPEERKNENGNGNRRRRRRRGGGNGNGDGGYGGGGGNGNGNGNGHHGNGNGNGGGGRQAAGSLVPYGSSVFNTYGRGGVYSPAGGGRFVSAPPPAPGGLVVQRMEKPPSPGSGTAMAAYASFQKGLVPSPGQPDVPPLPVPPLSPRPKLPGPNGNGHNGTNGHGTNGSNGNGHNGHGANGGPNGNGHGGANGHETGGSGHNGHGTNGSNGKTQPTPAESEPNGHAQEGPGQASRAAPAGPPAVPAKPPVALDRATVAALMAAEMRGRRRRSSSQAIVADDPRGADTRARGAATLPGIGGRTTPTPDGSGVSGLARPSGEPRSTARCDSAGPSTPPPSLSSPPNGPRRPVSKYEPAPYPFTPEE